MVWDNSFVAVANAAFTAAQFNAHVRDNLNETEVAKAINLHEYFVSTGANAITTRKSVSQYVHGIVETGSTSYTDLSGGAAVTVATGDRALVFINCGIANTSTNAAGMVSFRVSGATPPISSSDDWMIAVDGNHGHTNPYEPYDEHNRRGIAKLMTGLTLGSNTFTMQFKVSNGTGKFNNRDIVVLPL